MFCLFVRSFVRSFVVVIIVVVVVVLVVIALLLRADKPEVTIFEGDSVLWQWEAAHNVVQVFDDKSNKSLSETHDIDGFGCVPAPAGHYFWTFREAGDYHYICEPHIECCNMRGVVHVLRRPTSSTPPPSLTTATRNNDATTVGDTNDDATTATGNMATTSVATR